MNKSYLFVLMLFFFSSATIPSTSDADKKYSLPFQSLDELNHMIPVNSVSYEGRDTTIVLYSFDGYGPMYSYEKKLEKIITRKNADPQQLVIINMFTTDTSALKFRVGEFEVPYYRTPWPDTETGGDLPITCCYVNGKLVWEARGYTRSLLKKVKTTLLANN